jgi:hypothetical protein
MAGPLFCIQFRLLRISHTAERPSLSKTTRRKSVTETDRNFFKHLGLERILVTEFNQARPVFRHLNITRKAGAAACLARPRRRHSTFTFSGVCPDDLHL